MEKLIIKAHEIKLFFFRIHSFLFIMTEMRNMLIWDGKKPSHPWYVVLTISL